MKKSFIIMIAALMVTAIGCQKKEDPSKAAMPQPAAQTAAPQASAAVPQAAPQTAAEQKPGAAPAGDPHAAFKGRELPAAGAGHKGKVLQVMDAGSYTYLEVEEKGQKLWVAAMKTTAKKGDVVEFPDSKPMENFNSKTLNKTFDKIFFADALRVVK